jgi:Fe2+ transport system protein FeoA
MKPFAERTQSNDCHPPGGPIHGPTPVTCALSRVRAGMLVRIKELSAPPAVTRRLREIGLGEEQVIRLLVRESNLICLVCNARLALSSQLAQMIVVEPLPA